MRSVDEATQHLLNKVNRVTSCHRHGRPICEQDLTMLSNAQIEYEEAVRAKEKDNEDADNT